MHPHFEHVWRWHGIEEIEGTGSAHKFASVKSMDVSISKYKPLKSGSYIALDDYLNNKKCLINIKNDDDKCLMYCVLLHIHLDAIKRDIERVTKYTPFLTEFDWSGINFPSKLNQIEKVENLVGH